MLIDERCLPAGSHLPAARGGARQCDSSMAGPVCASMLQRERQYAGAPKRWDWSADHGLQGASVEVGA